MRRFAILAVAALLGMALPAATAARTVVSVPGQAGWVDTGINVEIGDELPVTTNGYVLTASIPAWHVPGVFKGASGPNGQVNYGRTCGAVWDTYDEDLKAIVGECAARDAYFGTLVGKVGDTTFSIGDTDTITAPASGRLYLGVNDYVLTYWDNHGAFTVLFG